ncbi:putative disease resistance protein [Abeliophyllum distichum]|uniref:Disease resistance protein n=1 Tax=Abeliophyllum distichum TaxID=126358 RepID=A0ABD1V6C4_9LAMI
MDDVWETNAWDEVRRLFPDKNNGSRIIWTTQLSNVAIYADSSGPIHHMNFLSLEQSLKLLNQLWVAEGFLKPITPKSLEEVAKEYLEDLIDRNLIMVRDWSYSGELKTCNNHDLIRDLIVRRAQEEKFLHIMNQKKSALPKYSWKNTV